MDTLFKKKKSFRNRHRKSSNNLKVKPLEQLENEVGKPNGKKNNSDKIPKNQVNKENNDNKKTDVEKKGDKKKNRYHKKKSVSDMKKDDTRSESISDSVSDVTSSTTNEKPDLKKSSSKQYLNQKKKRKSKMNLKQEEEKEEDNSDIKLIESFLTSLSMKRDEMEREEEELINNPPPPHNVNKYKKPYNKANKPKKEIPRFDDQKIKKVLDCYDFPTAYKTHNLIEIFKEYEGCFSITWINDSRALFIFDTEEHARAAYLSKINETKYVIKPFENPPAPKDEEFSPYNDDEDEDGDEDGDEDENEENEVEEEEEENEEEIEKEEIKKQPTRPSSHQTIQSSIRPSTRSISYAEKTQSKSPIKPKPKSTTPPKYISNETQEKPVRRQRPVTSDVVARRLISSALGIKPKEKTEEEKEIDRKKFEEARAQRLAARLERQKRLQENSDIFNEWNIYIFFF